MSLPDFRFAPNQAGRPDLYELENRAVDPDGLVLQAMRELAPWTGRTLVDLGCGSGYWLPGYAAEASEVIGVEPDPALLPLARARDRRVQVMPGSAEHIPLGDASVDVVHARFAYFWPPGCQAGLTEVLRVLRPGGALVVIDNDHRAGEFARLLRAAGGTAQGRADITDAWWAVRGAVRAQVMSRWEFGSRSDFENVLRLEFPTGVAESWLVEHPDACGLSYGYVLFTVRSAGHGWLPHIEITPRVVTRAGVAGWAAPGSVARAAVTLRGEPKLDRNFDGQPAGRPGPFTFRMWHWVCHVLANETPIRHP